MTLLALNTDHDAYGDVSHSINREELIRLLLSEEIDPTAVVEIQLDINSISDVSDDIAEEVLAAWIEKSDEYALKHSLPPKFAREHISDWEVEDRTAEALQSIADEAAHVRAISSPEAMGRI